MQKFTKEMVNNYAEKLLIGLTEDENKQVLDEFTIIDTNIDLINQIKDIDKVEPMTHALDDFIYELRSDIKEESIDIDEALSNCDDKTDREVSVPKVVG